MTRISGKSARHAALLSGAALALPLWAAPALAQDAEEEANSNDIIVTAQRRSERLEEVPMTVSVVTADTLRSAGLTSLRDLANVTTGFSLAQGGGFPQPAIRGITTVINGTFENNVAVYVDGLYQVQAQSINIDLPNIDSVQILKGPQGTLYGRNATGGAILLNTIDPGKDWKGRVEVTYARFDDKRASGYVAGPLSEKAGISLAGYVRRSDGYIKFGSRTTPGQTAGNGAPLEQDSFRGKLRFELSDSFRATVGYGYTHVSDPRGNLFTPYENVRSVYAPAFATIPKVLGTVAYDIGTMIDTKQHEGSLTMELDTGIGTLKSITGYGQVTATTAFDFDGSYLNGQWSTSTIRNRTFQQAIDFSIDTVENLDLIVGGTYFQDKLKFISPSKFYLFFVAADPGTVEIPLSSYTLLTTSFFEQKKEAWALYADATYHVTDRLSINAGGRYSEETQNVSGRVDSSLASSARSQVAVGERFKKFTPRASIRYEISPRTNLYFTYSKGFRSGVYGSQLPACVNTVPLSPTCYVPAKQEEIDSFEVGLKSAGSSFRYELAGFYYDYKNLQVSATRTLSTGQAIVDIVSAPKAKVYGAEASFEWEPMENLKLRGGAAWLHARYGEGFLFQGTGVANAGAGGGIALNTNADPLKTYNNVNQLQNLSGLQMSRAPDFTANFGLEYNIPRDEGGIRLSANVRYTDSYVVTNPSVWGYVLTAAEMAQAGVAQNNNAGVPADKIGKQRFRQSAYALLNASVTWTDPSGHYSVRVYGTNLTDKRYRLHYTGNNTWGTYSPMAEPLTFGATLGYKF